MNIMREREREVGWKRREGERERWVGSGGRERGEDLRKCGNLSIIKE